VIVFVQTKLAYVAQRGGGHTTIPAVEECMLVLRGDQLVERERALFADAAACYRIFVGFKKASGPTAWVP